MVGLQAVLDAIQRLGEAIRRKSAGLVGERESTATGEVGNICDLDWPGLKIETGGFEFGVAPTGSQRSECVASSPYRPSSNQIVAFWNRRGQASEVRLLP